MPTQTKTKETMNFSLNEDQLMLQQTIRDFVAKEVIPHARDWDEKEEVPIPTIKKLATLGGLAYQRTDDMEALRRRKRAQRTQLLGTSAHIIYPFHRVIPFLDFLIEII